MAPLHRALLGVAGFLLLADAVRADILPDPGASVRGLATHANGFSHSIVAVEPDPFDESSFSEDTFESPICGLSIARGEATQTSSITPTQISVVGTARVTQANMTCFPGASSSASSQALIAFELEQTQEVILTGSTVLTLVSLRSSGGTVHFERFPVSIAQPIAFAQTLPAGDYVLEVLAVNTSAVGSVWAEYQVSLEATPAPGIPILPSAALTTLAAALLALATRATRHARVRGPA